MKKLPTIAMTPMPEYGYNPIPLILYGEKVHTLRKQRCHGRKEVTVGGERTGIIVEFHGWVEMRQDEFLCADFADADGFNYEGPWLMQTKHAHNNLRDFLRHFYGEVPETMFCCYFRVVQRPEEEQK